MKTDDSLKKNNGIDILIKNNESYLDDINQYCHNKGILFDVRIKIVIDILKGKNNDIIDNETYNFVKQKLDENLHSKEVI